MADSAAPRTTPRRIPGLLVAGMLVVMAAIAPTAVPGLLASSSTTAAAPTDAVRIDQPGAQRPVAAAPIDVAGSDQHGRPVPVAAAPIDIAGSNQPALGEADGVVPDGTTVFDDGVPGVANLDRDLLRALRRAAMDASRDGITFYVDSGWRSRAYQNQLLREAVSKYGSEQEAARWVATPDTSPHVSGDAVDIGHVDATAWLSEHGARYGLCQIYRNEPWHYELRAGAIDHGCPGMYADPTYDPRMQQ